MRWLCPAGTRRILYMVMRFSTHMPGRMPTVAVLLLAVIAAVCLVDLATAATVVAAGHDCFGPSCEDQFVCGQPAQPQASPGHPGQLIAVPIAVEAPSAPEKTATLAQVSPGARVAWQPVAPLAPRAPPAA